MSVLFSTIKCFVFAFNLICLILGIADICVCALGLENAKPGSDEHTYFVVAIVLAALVCMTTFFGCYGVVCELLGVNLIYAFFLLVLLIVQFLQMQTLKPQTFNRLAMNRLEEAWHLVQKKPHLMQTFEVNYQCCGLYGFHDYDYMRLAMPRSCYLNRDMSVASNLYSRGCLQALQLSHHTAVYRAKIFNWSLFIAECIAFVYSLGLSIILAKQQHWRRFVVEPVRGFVEPHTNHITSRTHLLSN